MKEGDGGNARKRVEGEKRKEGRVKEEESRVGEHR